MYNYLRQVDHLNPPKTIAEIYTYNLEDVIENMWGEFDIETTKLRKTTCKTCENMKKIGVCALGWSNKCTLHQKAAEYDKKY